MTQPSPAVFLLFWAVVAAVRVAASSSLFPAIISGRVEGRWVELQEAGKLVGDVLQGDEMDRCSILLLQDASSVLPTPLPPSVQSHQLGVTFSSVTESQPRPRNESDDTVCKTVVVVARGGTWRRLLQSVSTTSLWPGHHHTLLLILSDPPTPLHPQDLLQHPAFRFSVQVVCAGRMEGSTWELYTTSLYIGAQRHSTLHLDTWTPKDGFRRQKPLFPHDKLANMEGYTFTVAALPYAPFLVPSTPTLSGPGKYRGLEVRLMDVLAAAANFSYRYVAPKDSQWGRLLKNGTWTGMIGMVVKEEADWAVSDITISPQREEFVDFSRPFVYDASELVTPKAQPLPRWLSPVRPFRGEVWTAVTVIMVAAGPFLWLIARSCYGRYKPRVAWFHKLGNAVIFTIGPMLQRGNKQDMVEMPGRIFSGFWLLFTMIVGISYSSSLTSFLIMPGLQKPIENLRQLVTSDIGWAKVYFGGVQSALLEETRDPVLVALREGVQWRDSLEGILSEVVSGRLATWDNSITTRLLVALKYTDKAGRPKVHFPGFELLQERIAWPMQQHAPYKRRLDELIARVVQAGLVTKWLEFIIFEEQNLARQRQETETETGEEETETVGSTVVLSLHHFQGPFFVLVLGCVAGGVILATEICISFFRSDMGRK